MLSSIYENGRSLGVLLALSVLLFLITSATYSSLGVVLPDMVREMHWNWSQAGLGFTLLGASCGASSWLPRILIRRFGVQTALIVGTFVMSGGLLGFGLSHNLLTYFASAVACGIGYQMMALIPGTHVIAGLFKNRARAMGFYFAAASVGGIAGPLIVFGIMAFFDWRQYWFVQAGACVLIGIICSLLIGRLAIPKPAADGTQKKAAPDVVPGSGWTVAEVLRTPQFYILLAAYFSHLLSGVTVASVSVAHLTETGILLGVAGAMLSLESVMGLGSRMGAGFIGDRISAKAMLLFALAANAVGCFALAIAHDYPMMILYAAGTGIGFGLTIVATTVLLLEYYGREHNLEIFSLTCLVGALSALGPVIAGIIRDNFGSFAPAFQIYGVAIALVGVAAIFMRPPVRKTSAPTEAVPPHSVLMASE
jgi:MFS family permease